MQAIDYINALKEEADKEYLLNLVNKYPYCPNEEADGLEDALSWAIDFDKIPPNEEETVLFKTGLIVYKNTQP